MSMKFLKTVAGAAVSSLWEKVSGDVVVKDTSANVGIGTDDPSGDASGDADNLVIKAASGEGGLSIVTGTSNVGAVFFTDGAGYKNQGTIKYAHASDTLTLSSSDSISLSGGDVTVSAGNLVVGTAGKGIDFSAQTPAAGMTAELLDHYEEGTWTAELKGLTSAATTPATVTGCYTRIGRQVNLTAFFSNVNTSGASGSMAVSGYPFTPPSTDAFRAAGSTVTYGLSVPNKGLTPTNQGAVDRCQFYSPTDDGDWASVNITAGSGKYLFLTITYVV